MEKISVRQQSGLVILKSFDGLREKALSEFLEEEAHVYLNSGYKRSGGYVPTFVETEDKVFLPRYTKLDERFRLLGTVWCGEPLERKYELYKPPKSHQIQAFKEALNNIESTGAANIVMRCGGGKTVLGLMIAAKLGLKTAIMVDTKQLAEQWKDRIFEWLGAEAEFYKNGKVPTKDFLIITIQSAYKIPPGSSLFNAYGTLILDESHINGAAKWGRAVLAFNGPNRIALSATPKRADGMDRLVNLHVGKPSVIIESDQIEDNFVQKCKVVIVPTGKNLEQFTRRWGQIEFDDAKTYDVLSSDLDRNRLLASLISSENKKGRNTLTVLNRLKSVDNISPLLEEIDFGLMIGGKNYAEEIKKQHLFGSYKVVRQAVDKPTLETIIFAAPFSDKQMIKQMLGRPERVTPGKGESLCFDIVDTSKSIEEIMFTRDTSALSSLESRAQSRIRYYLSEGYDVFILKGEKLAKLEKSYK